MRLLDLWPFGRKKNWVPTQEGLVNQAWEWNYWQSNQQPRGTGLNETVEACVSTLAQTVAMCPIHLLEEQEDGEQKRLRGRNPERVLQYPNSYQTRSLFFTNAIRSLYLDGNAFAVAQRDDRGAVSQLHLMNSRATRGVVSPETGEIFYWASPNFNDPLNYMAEEDRVFPARDVLHLRLYTGRDPLRGETPIQAAANAISANTAMVGHQAAFFGNMSRPSGVISTDAELNAEQMAQLRTAWEQQSKKLASGGIPILSNGLKWQSMSLSSQDAQLAEAYGMTVAGISRAFRVPLPLINDMTGSTFNNAESLMSWFLASGLGFLLEHIELELGRLFGLSFDQRLNFETRALLRSDWKTRIEALGEGVIKGIYSPNEARAREGLPAVEGGDEPRVQQQVVPLTANQGGLQEPEPEPEPAPTVEAAMASMRKGMEAYG